MVNPISTNISHTHEAAKQAQSKPVPQQQKTPQPSDTVTLKSAANTKDDGDTR
jgi:hypothetical protein